MMKNTLEGMRRCLYFGIALALPPASQLRADVTFSQEVVRLLQAHCQSCHHPGGLAPFPLLAYEDARSHARLIKAAVVSGRMPHGASVRLDTGCTKPDTFTGARRLTQDEIDTFSKWVDAGAPEGDPSELPPAITFADSEWKGGEPDVIFPNTPGGFAVPPQLGRDLFRKFPIQTAFDSDRYIISFEALPGSDDEEQHLNRTVHHVGLWIDPACNSLQQEAEFAASNREVLGRGFEGTLPSPNTLVEMWFPGSPPLQMPDGIGIKAPRGACLVMEVHYATYKSVPVLDKTLVGLKFATAPIQKERLGKLNRNTDFTIPAGFQG